MKRIHAGTDLTQTFNFTEFNISEVGNVYFLLLNPVGEIVKQVAIEAEPNFPNDDVTVINDNEVEIRIHRAENVEWQYGKYTFQIFVAYVNLFFEDAVEYRSDSYPSFRVVADYEKTKEGDGTDVSFPIGGAEGAVQTNELGVSDKPSESVTEEAISQQEVNQEFKTFKDNSSTGILWGGVVTVNVGDDTKYDVSAGQALIVDTHTNQEKPVPVLLTWPNQIGVDVENIGIQLTTFVVLEDDGAGNPLFTQSNTVLGSKENRSKVEIGVVVHTNLTNINKTSSIANWAKDTDLKVLDLAGALGQLPTSGNTYFSSGGKKLSKTSGRTLFLNGNRATDAEDPNYVNSAKEDDMSFLSVWGGTPAGILPTSEIDTDFYDPDGLGVLTAMPLGSYTTHGVFFDPNLGITVVHYGQFLYDSLKKAVQSWNFEAYNVVSELGGVPLMGVIAFGAGASDLDNEEQARFIKPPMLGIRGTTPVPNYSKFADSIEIIDGMSYNRPSITYVNDSGTLYAELEAVGGGNMVYVFNQQEYILDCTSGLGANGRARVALSAGADYRNPVENFIYVTKLGENTAQLNSAISEPTGQFGWAAQALMPDAVTFDTTGPYSTQRNSDNKSHDGRGALSYEREKIRDLGVSYKSGITPTITITDLLPDTLDVTTSGGVIKQLHKKIFPPLDSTIDGIYVINHPTTPWLRVTKLGDIQIDAQGNSLNNRAFNFVFVPIANTADGVEYSKLGVLLPNGSYGYTDLQNAMQDVSNTAVTSVPQSLQRTAFLNSRVTFKYKTGVWNNVIEDELSPQTFFDLRNTPLGGLAGGVGAPAVTKFLDTVFKIISNISAYELGFILDNLTSNKNLTVQDKDGVIATLSDINMGNYIPIDETDDGEALVNGTAYVFDAGVSAFGILLPASPTQGERIRAYFDDVSANDITFGGNGTNIDGSATYVASSDVDKDIIEFVYNEADLEWKVKNLTTSEGGGASNSAYDEIAISANGQTTTVDFAESKAYRITFANGVTDHTLAFTNALGLERIGRDVILDNRSNNSSIEVLTLSGTWRKSGGAALSQVAALGNTDVTVVDLTSSSVGYYYAIEDVT